MYRTSDFYFHPDLHPEPVLDDVMDSCELVSLPLGSEAQHDMCGAHAFSDDLTEGDTYDYED